jgi:hypothetical protein
MRRLRQTAVAATALVTVTLGATAMPATAAERLPLWTPVPCAEGAVTGHEPARDADGTVGGIAVEGWIRPCAGLEQPAAFGVIRYHETAGLLLYGSDGPPLNSRPYGSATEATNFTAAAWNVAILAAAYGPLRAVCLARTPLDPLACVALEPDADGQLRTVAIPVDDDRVRVLIRQMVLMDSDIGPWCGTCV